MSKRQALAFAGFLFGMGLVSCNQKHAEDSGAQSLDNFAAGRQVYANVCKPHPKYANDPQMKLFAEEIEKHRVAWDTGAGQGPILKALTDSFGALPPPVQSQFLGSGGLFLVTSAAKANEICTGGDRRANLGSKARNEAEIKALKEGYDAVKACYLLLSPGEVKALFKDKGGKATDPVWVVVLNDVAADVAHNTVRVFGYLNAQVGGHLWVDGDFLSPGTKVGLTEKTNPKFFAQRAALAQAFLEDLKATRPQLHARFQDYDAQGKASAEMKSAFQDFVYAEAFDSYFCNQADAGDANTHDRFAKLFKKTYSQWLSQWQKPDRGLKLADDAAGGFALANPFTWVSNKWNNYTTSRDAIVNNLTQQVIDGNGGQPPSFWQTVSIGANAAWRPAAEAPLVGGVIKPAVRYTNAISGVDVNTQTGDSRLLSDGERYRQAAAGTADIAINQATAALGSAAAARGTAAVQDALIDTGAGRALTTAVLDNAPGVARATWNYGAQATGAAIKQGVGYMGGQVQKAADGAVAGDSVVDRPAPASAPAPGGATFESP